jgi:hypothetical protein
VGPQTRIIILFATMSFNITYSINDSKAISEMLDGETIIINLESGNYYSLNATGSILWNNIKDHCPISQIIAHFAATYDAPAEEIEKSVMQMVDFLKADNLILEGQAVDNSVPKKTVVDKKEAWVAPTIQRYEDMQAMLLADPIHDVDQSGWPTLK